jgi:hypothetical protein
MDTDVFRAVIEELRSRERLTAVTETQARQYAHAVEEVERLTAAQSDLTPGTPEHKRVSTALRGAARERDSLARHLGLTALERRRDRARAPKQSFREFWREHRGRS